MNIVEKYEKYVVSRKYEVTVFIVTYNRCELFKKTLESVRNQTFRDMAIVVIDNASTDGTAIIMEELNDDRCFYYRQNENIGGIGNINTAFKIAKTPYYIIFHDDDLMKKNFVETELLEMKKGEFVCVSCEARYIDENSNKEVEHEKFKERKVFNSMEYVKNVYSTGESVLFPTVMYHKNFIDKNKLLLDEKAGPCCDFYLLSEICRLGGTICVLPDELLIRTIHDGMDSIRSAFWMNIQVLNYFSVNPNYRDVIREMQSEVLNGYIINSIHMLANAYEGKVSYEKARSLLNDIQLEFYNSSWRKALMMIIINTSNNRIMFFSRCVHVIRFIVRIIKRKLEAIRR